MIPIKPIYWGAVLLLGLLMGLLVACADGDDDDDAPVATASAPPPATVADCATNGNAHDGVYAVSFYSQVERTALGTFRVTDNAFSGDLVNINSERFTIAGCVTPEGQLVFTQLASDQNSAVTADGLVKSNGFVSGNIAVGNRNGIFFGSRDNAPTEDTVTTLFDGLYDLSFIRDRVVRATATIRIENSRFDFAASSVDGIIFEVEGYVKSDGTLVFNSLENSLDLAALGEGFIDIEDLSLEGLYRLGDLVGTVEGQFLER